MTRNLAALAVAAVAAALIAGVVPEVASGSSPSAEPPAAGVVKTAPVGLIWDVWQTLACADSCPYYEQDCLYDARQPDGKARVVRVISVDQSNNNTVSRARH